MLLLPLGIGLPTCQFVSVHVADTNRIPSIIGGQEDSCRTAPSPKSSHLQLCLTKVILLMLCRP